MKIITALLCAVCLIQLVKGVLNYFELLWVFNFQILPYQDESKELKTHLPPISAFLNTI